MTYECEINLKTALDWQRSNADICLSYINKKQEWYEANHCQFWNDWVTDVFTLSTANEFGLSVWAAILDESLFGVTTIASPTFKAFGFGPNRYNFNNGNFAPRSGEKIELTLDQKRKVLQLKAYVLHMSGSVFEINQRLSAIFGERSIFAIDNLDMTLTYVINDRDLRVVAVELENRDLLPRPAGVGIKDVIFTGVKRWGFGPFRYNFNNGNFSNGRF